MAKAHLVGGGSSLAEHDKETLISATMPAAAMPAGHSDGARSDLFWCCSERLDHAKRCQALGCHEEARAACMEGFGMLLDVPGSLSISWSVLFLLKAVSCSWALADHNAVVVAVTSLLVLMQHLSQRQLMCQTTIRPLIRQMLIMRGTSLHVQGRAALGQRDWALVKASCARDELALYSLIIETYQHVVVRAVIVFVFLPQQPCAGPQAGEPSDSDNSTTDCDPLMDTASSDNTRATKRQKTMLF